MSSSESADFIASALQLQKDGRYAEALGVLERLLERAPELPDANYLKSLSLHRLARAPEAIAALRRAIELKPDDPGYRSALGFMLQAVGDWEAAAEAFAHAARATPESAGAHYHLAMVRMAQHRLEEATAGFARVVTLQPNHVEAWKHLSVLLRLRGDYRRAFGALAAAIRYAPDDAVLHFERARTHYEIGEHDAAAEALRQCLRLDPAMEEATFMLAAMGRAPAPETAPAKYVASLFDGYAQTFDEHLRTELDYRGPEVISGVLTTLALPERSLVVLDAGCGTGLMGSVLRPYAKHLHGLDLSPAMIGRARCTSLYDELTVGELASFLTGRVATYDLIVAADVLVYFGDLSPVFAKASAALGEGGIWITTTEFHDGEGYRLHPAGRFAHSTEYVAATASGAGLAVVSQDGVILRKEADKDVQSLLSVFRRR